MLTIGEQIRQVRKAKKMTLEELGEKIGVKNPTVHKYEKGVIKNIPVDRLCRIEQALCCHFEKELFITFRQSDYTPEVWEIIKRLHKIKKEM